MNAKLTIGLIADQPNIIVEDVYKSLKNKFNVTKLETISGNYPAFDFYLLASSLSDKNVVSQVRQKIPIEKELLVVSPMSQDLEIDTQSKAIFYPYKYEIITNLPLILNTLYNVAQIRPVPLKQQA